ncbi:hypothetical protein WJ78_18000 [Burkholderia ubonensis]|uniref:hypothetical protein n=1 Tax=Burkholderia ubonensis TaxID=101571 RepID=UPI000756BF71|nr:hypothetical protein [Burkholderia ubonensis]KVO65013.1 hypothetical protein WJ78_18000 [Burkholderia ubonensis]
MNWTHDALQEDLAAYVRERTQRIVWTNMQLGPAGSPRPDVYAVPLSFSRFTPLAYEIKVSVADFRRDVAAGKWQSYLRYASGVTFAVPSGLIGKADVPDGCGLLARADDGWRTLKAPKLRPIDCLPRDAWIKLLIDGMERERERVSAHRRAEYAVTLEVERRVGADVAKLIRDRDLARGRYERATSNLETAAADADREYREHMQHARERAERDAARLDEARSELAAALGLLPAASVSEIIRAARDAADRLSESREIARLSRTIDSVSRALELARVEVPAIAGRAAA